MRIHYYLLLPLIGICLTLIVSCKDDECFDETDPTCENYDPCLKEQPVSAKFHLYEAQAGITPEAWEPYDTDTLGTTRVVFTALEEDAEYEWRLGSEVIREKSFVRLGFPTREPIPVTLIVRKQPNNSCFPEDDGIDSLTRTFVVYAPPYRCRDFIQTPVPGTYEGFFGDDQVTPREVRIEACEMYLRPKYRGGFDTLYVPSVFGLFPGSGCRFSAVRGYRVFWGYRQWLYSSDNFFVQSEIDCGGILDFRAYQPEGTDSIYITFKHTDIDEENTEADGPFSFIGIRKK